MRLAQYLTESRTQKVNKNFAIKWLKDNPGGMKEPIYRGVENSGLFLLAKPSQSERQSAHTEFNYYTLLLDNLPSWSKFPKRSKSLVCTTERSVAKNYGLVYRIYPKTGSKIGMCPADDMWNSFSYWTKLEDLNYLLSSFFKYAKGLNFFNFAVDPWTWQDLVVNFKEMDRWKDMFIEETAESYLEDNRDDEDMGEEDMGEREKALMASDSFQDFQDDILDWSSINKPEKYKNFWPEWIGSDKRFLDYLSQLVDPVKNGFQVKKLGENLDNGVEVWTDGDCLMVDVDEVEELEDMVR